MATIITACCMSNGVRLVTDDDWEAVLKEKEENVFDFKCRELLKSTDKDFSPKWLQKIPIIRSVIYWLEWAIEIIFYFPLVALFIAAINILPFIFHRFFQHHFNFLPHADLRLKLLVFWFLAFVLMLLNLKRIINSIKKKRMWHGVEHKICNCHFTEQEMAMENVRNASRYSVYCGTKIATIILIPTILSTFFLPLLFSVIIFIILTEVFLSFRGWNEPISKFIQLYLTTSEPSDEQIAVTIEATKLLLGDRPEKAILKIKVQE